MVLKYARIVQQKDGNRELLLKLDEDVVEGVSINKNERGIYLKLNRPLTPEEQTNLTFLEEYHVTGNGVLRRVDK